MRSTAVSPPAAASVQLSLVGAPAGYAIAADGTISVPTGVTSGAATLTYQICETAAPTNCDTATVSLVITPTRRTTRIRCRPAAPSATATSAANDDLPAGSTWTVQGTAPAGLTFNADGTFTYTPPVGTISPVGFTYQACLPAPNAALCGSRQRHPQHQRRHAGGGRRHPQRASPPGGTTSVSVLANDTLNAVSPPLPASVVLTLVGAPAGYTINADGTLGVASTVTSGTTTLTYQICEAAAPTNCDTASVTVIVSPSPQNDAFSVQAGQTLSNSVADNDSLPAGSIFTVQGTPPAGLTFNGDGAFTYTPPTGTPSPVNFTYQACLPAPNVALCGTASVTINIGTGTLLAGNDTLSGVGTGHHLGGQRARQRQPQRRVAAGRRQRAAEPGRRTGVALRSRPAARSAWPPASAPARPRSPTRSAKPPRRATAPPPASP